MAKSTLIIYEPIEKFGKMSEYWEKYIYFYESYWGGSTSPYGVWFGEDYLDFQDKLSEFLKVDKIQDCLFMKGEKGNYLISPLRSFKNKYIIDSDNIIPLEWFFLFEGEERKFLYTRMGFARIHYGSDLNKCFKRIRKADEIIESSILKNKREIKNSKFFKKISEIQSRIYELGVWLSEFDEGSYLVLDYGEICSYISPYTLNLDYTSNDVWTMLSDLKKSNIEKSSETLNLLIEKWDKIKQIVTSEVFNNDIQ